jgi:hypothetical protein
MQHPSFWHQFRPVRKALLASASGLLLSTVGCSILQNPSKIGGKPDASDATAQPNQSKLFLGTFVAIAGTPYQIAPIDKEQNYRQSLTESIGSYEKTASSARNFLILNAGDRSAVRVAPKNDWLFLDYEAVGRKNSTGTVTQPKGLLYNLVKADSDKDKRLSNDDVKSVMFSDVSGKNSLEVVPEYDRMLGKFQPAPNLIVFAYSIGQKNLTTTLDLETRKVGETKELPSLE